MTVSQCLRNGPDGPIMAEGEVVLVTYDYRRGETILLPDNWREALARFEDFS
jgi:acyl-CoA thioesterase FadM